MWLVSDADTKIYLLGTMHALPARMSWEGGKVGDAVSAADELVMELAPKELAAAGGVFQELAPRTRPLAMETRLPPAAYARFRTVEKDGGFDGDGLDDWAVLVLIGQQIARRAELDPANGVETGLTRHFRATGKAIGGLETAREQLMIFETLDPQTQRALLTRAATGADTAVADVEAMTTAWASGDVAALERMINEDVEAVPAARQAIIADRNHRWAAWARARMARPGTVLLAVGAGHLVGDDGLPALLAAEGLAVRRVQ